MCNKLWTTDPDVPVVAMAIKNACEIVQFFNKSTQATKNWRISSKSLPWPNIVVNPRTFSRMSRLGGGRRIVCWRGYNFYERQSAIMWLTILKIQILQTLHLKSGEYVSRQWHSGSASLRVRRMSLVPSSQWQFLPFANHSCKLLHLLEVIKLWKS